MRIRLRNRGLEEERKRSKSGERRKEGRKEEKEEVGQIHISTSIFEGAVSMDNLKL